MDEAQAGGGIGEDERVLIRSAIEFDELEAVDIYTQRIDIVGIPVDMPKYLRTPDIRDFRSMRKILTRSLVFYIRKIFTTLFTVRM